MREGSSEQRSSAGPGIVVVLLATVAGGVAGAVAGGALAAQESAPAASTDPALASSLRQLAETLGALQLTLARPLAAQDAAPSAPAGTSAEPAPAPLTAPPDLQVAIQALADALTAAARGASSGSTFTVPTPDAARHDKALKLVDQGRDVALRNHMLWTGQQLLDAYGPPDSIQLQDPGDAWIYGRLGVNQPHVSFLVHEGRVIQVYLQ
ncbi:MAG TPA: hypothetical protein VFY71_00325 [Planctomycetota bacterium]|nr:hypothetical protein [Planctomycetota bacterium]